MSETTITNCCIDNCEKRPLVAALREAEVEVVRLTEAKRRALALADERAKEACELFQILEVAPEHIALLKSFIGYMTVDNWRDMRLRAERQLEELSDALQIPAQVIERPSDAIFAGGGDGTFDERDGATEPEWMRNAAALRQD